MASLEFEKFLSTLLSNVDEGLSVLDFFERNRIPPEIKVYAVYCYLSRPVSLRELGRDLEDFGINVKHVSIWRWVQKIGKYLKGEVFRKKERELLVIDETELRIRGDWIWIYAAIDPENREIVNIHVSKHRELPDILLFFRKCLENCKDKPAIITDGGPWYEWPAERLGLEHHVISGGDRNYVERWFETLKDRLRAFDCYFPTENLELVENFIRAFCHHYNHSRHHITLKGPPTGGRTGIKKWLEALK